MSILDNYKNPFEPGGALHNPEVTDTTELFMFNRHVLGQETWDEAVAKVANKQQNITMRPSWQAVYDGYPKNADGTDDLRADKVFKKIFGDKYDENKKELILKGKPNIPMKNACATRVSLGLLNAGMQLKYGFNVRAGQFMNKTVITSVYYLKKWLLETEEFAVPDIIINTNKYPYQNQKGKLNLSNIKAKIGNRNGIYIIIPYSGCFHSAYGHATLWVGEENNVIGGHNYVSCIGQMYFWELV